MKPTGHFADVSHYEPDIDFHAYAAGGCPLIITKATEGSTYTDPTYAGFAARARSVPGLIFGSYVFIDAGDPGPQISHYLSAAHLKPGDLQPCVDAEAAGLTKNETLDALRQLEASGYRPLLYCSLSFYVDVLGSPTQWWLWLAAYRDTLPKLPAGTKLFAWQHVDNGICPGVAHPCDMSYLYVPVADLKTKFCI